MRREAGPMPPRAGNVTMSNRKLIHAFGADRSASGLILKTMSLMEKTGIT
ncbi:hypothetical protein BROSI_A1370 [Candidatus Brocadia sinica JPN1]|uniref:Uncharacterized protein n=1 Tax=Candidatus Brocadia sinica JPN1 TaxID=1197129 RepID=A0ABQ0JVS2_9BACT|nr:hypothetical protein BROSI_A1370 [Candidatus Brocadia sinica JPN1]